jgi:hypothetical protein
MISDDGLRQSGHIFTAAWIVALAAAHDGN